MQILGCDKEVDEEGNEQNLEWCYSFYRKVDDENEALQAIEEKMFRNSKLMIEKKLKQKFDGSKAAHNSFADMYISRIAKRYVEDK